MNIPFKLKSHYLFVNKKNYNSHNLYETVCAVLKQMLQYRIHNYTFHIFPSVYTKGFESHLEDFKKWTHVEELYPKNTENFPIGEGTYSLFIVPLPPDPFEFMYGVNNF